MKLLCIQVQHAVECRMSKELGSSLVMKYTVKIFVK